MAEKAERLVVDVQVPLDYTYNYRVGPYLEKYIKGLGEKKVLGVKCPGCSKVAVPPRKICGTCNKVMDEWVEVGPEGTVENFTIGHVKLDRGAVEKLDPPQLLAMIKLDGATVPLMGEIKGLEPAGLEKGLRVKAVFKDPAEDSVADLSHFEPAG
jgi:uncharacterized OB-fold protein